MRPDHYLLVGDAGDLPDLTELISRLPADVYGQVAIEVDVPGQVCHLEVPEAMSVTWLVRQDRADATGRAPAPGELAAWYLASWVDEWIWDEVASRPMPYVLWIGCCSSPHVDHLYQQLMLQFGNLHLHHPNHA